MNTRFRGWQFVVLLILRPFKWFKFSRTTCLHGSRHLRNYNTFRNSFCWQIIYHFTIVSELRNQNWFNTWVIQLLSVSFCDSFVTGSDIQLSRDRADFYLISWRLIVLFAALTLLVTCNSSTDLVDEESAFFAAKMICWSSVGSGTIGIIYQLFSYQVFYISNYLKTTIEIWWFNLTVWLNDLKSKPTNKEEEKELVCFVYLLFRLSLQPFDNVFPFSSAVQRVLHFLCLILIQFYLNFCSCYLHQLSLILTFELKSIKSLYYYWL